jgi:hypothetical protein
VIKRESLADKVIAFIAVLPIAILIFFCVYALEALFLKLLWNWLIVDIFKLRAITFLEAFGLCLIGLMFFGGHFKNKSE